MNMNDRKMKLTLEQLTLSVGRVVLKIMKSMGNVLEVQFHISCVSIIAYQVASEWHEY